MESYLITKKPVADEIAKYLDKVFGGFSSPNAADADHWRDKLGVEVTLEDLDLIYTLAAIEHEDQNFLYDTVGKPWMKTQMFLGAIHDMRVEMEKRLRNSVAELESQDVSDFVAVQKTMGRTMDAQSLRQKVIASAGQLCREMTLRDVRKADYFAPKGSVSFRRSSWFEFRSLIVTPIIYMTCIAFERDLHELLQHNLFYAIASAFLLGAFLSPMFSIKIPTRDVLKEANRFLSKPPVPGAIAKQRLRFFLFKLWNVPQPYSLWSSRLSITVMAIVVGICLHYTHYHCDMATLWICLSAGIFFGARLSSRLRATREDGVNQN